jgi:transposase
VYKVEVYARVRRAVQVDGMSVRQAAREFGVARKTIRRMLEYCKRLVNHPCFCVRAGLILAA